MPSMTVRLTVEAAFIALVALGAALAGLEPILVVAVVAGAALLVALVERAFAREAARNSERPPEEALSEELAGPRHIESVDAEPAAEPDPEAEPAKERELAVSERSARAILASGPPPLQETQPRVAAPAPEPEPEPEPGPEPAPEPEPVSSGPPREWNVWELQRLVRDQPNDDRQEEWTAMTVSLRDFARADGTLPPEFDKLVRDSFGELLADARTEAAAAP